MQFSGTSRRPDTPVPGGLGPGPVGNSCLVPPPTRTTPVPAPRRRTGQELPTPAEHDGPTYSVDRRRARRVGSPVRVAPQGAAPALGVASGAPTCHGERVTISPTSASHPVHEQELVFAHVRAVLGAAEASPVLPRLSRRKTARALASAGFCNLTGEPVRASALKHDGTQFFDRSETVLVESLNSGRRFYGLFVEPTSPTHEDWATITDMFAELGRRVHGRLAPADQFRG